VANVQRQRRTNLILGRHLKAPTTPKSILEKLKDNLRKKI